MPRVRGQNRGKYKLERHEFFTAYHYALQYNAWRDQYEALDGRKAIAMDGMPHGTTCGNPTEAIGMKRAALADKMRLIERVANEVAPDLYKWLFKAVTNEGITFPYLETVMNIPCSKNTFYEVRRKFYYRLASEMDKK